MTNEGPEPDHRLDIRRVDAALANLRKQHLRSAIGDEQSKFEYQALQRQRQTLEPKPSGSVDSKPGPGGRTLAEPPRTMGTPRRHSGAAP